MRGLDSAPGLHRIGDIRLPMAPTCQHTRTEVIARRDGVDYVHCLDCQQILEAEDLESVPSSDEEEPEA